MTGVDLARAVLWGPLTPVRVRKAVRLVESREHFAAMLAAIANPVTRAAWQAAMQAAVEARV